MVAWCFDMKKNYCFLMIFSLLISISSISIFAGQDDIESVNSIDELNNSKIADDNQFNDDQKVNGSSKLSDDFLNEVRNIADNRPVEAFDIDELQKELMKILAAHYESLKKKREDMFEKLSLQNKDRIKKSEKLFQNIVEKITITSVLFDEMNAVWDLGVNGSFSFLSEDKEQLLIDLLIKLKKSIEDKTFVMLMRGFDGDDCSQPGSVVLPDQIMNMSMNLGKKPIVSFTSDDLERFVYFLEDIKSHFGSNIPEKLESFYKFLSSIHYKKNHDLAMLVLAKIKPEFDEVFSYIKESIEVFEAAIKQETDISTREAYDFWFKTLRRFYRSLLIFDSLQNDASFSSTKFSNDLFALVTYGYDIARGFFDLYNLDNSKNGSLWGFSGPVAADWALRSSLATWQFFNSKATFLDGMLLQTILGDLKIDTYEARQILIFNVFALSGAGVVLLDPTFWNKKPYGLAKAFHKVATAWIYYIAFDSNLFGDGMAFEPWVSGADKLDASGRRKDRHIRKALLYAIEEGTTYLSYAIQQQIIYNVNPVTLENVRTYSMGIIRPAMISYALKALIPFIFINDSNLGNPPVPMVNQIVSFDRSDLFAFDKGDSLIQNFIDYSKKYNGFIKDEFYLEAVLFSYIGESVGSFWGRRLAQAYKSHICSAGETILWACGSLFETIGLIDAGWFDEWKSFKDDVAQDFEQKIVLIKFFLKHIFDVNSDIRSSIVRTLVNWGDLNEDETNPFEINRKIVLVAVNFLSRWRLLTNYDAAIIARKFDADSLSLDKVIDNICDAISANIAGLTGESAGGLFGYYGAKWILSHYGSLYDRFIETNISHEN